MSLTVIANATIKRMTQYRSVLAPTVLENCIEK